MKEIRVGVIGVQGAVSEHMEMSHRALRELGLEGKAIWVRNGEQLDEADALIIPGGESTTISKFMVKNRLFDRVVERAREGMPVMGTCAGCVLLGKRGDGGVERTNTKLLGLMDMAVERNAFGRQSESCEVPLQIDGVGDFHAVFIRAPAITNVWGKCEPLARFNGKIVMASQDNLMALAFHPELTNDARLHRLLIERVRK